MSATLHPAKADTVGGIALIDNPRGRFAFDQACEIAGLSAHLKSSIDGSEQLDGSIGRLLVHRVDTLACAIISALSDHSETLNAIEARVTYRHAAGREVNHEWPSHLALASRPRLDRRPNRPLHGALHGRDIEIKAAGYDGGYTRVTDFARACPQSKGQEAAGKAFVPLAFQLGEAFQFDWNEEGLVVGGIYCRMQVSHMKLCASRAFWLVACPSQGHEMLFDAHTRSFSALGGVARRGIYDNIKTAVDEVKKGKGRVVDERLATMCAHYLYDPDSSTWPVAGRR